MAEPKYARYTQIYINIYQLFGPTCSIIFSYFLTKFHSFVIGHIASWHLRFCPLGSLDQVVHSSKFQSGAGCLIFKGFHWDFFWVISCSGKILFLQLPDVGNQKTLTTINQCFWITRCFSLPPDYQRYFPWFPLGWGLAAVSDQGHGIPKPRLQDQNSITISYVPKK